MKSKAGFFIGFSLSCLLTLAVFLAVFTFKYPIRYDNMGGDNIWQSASTVKYVNIWLEEGAASMHFTACENYRSVEFQSFSDRVPFVSYPSGHIFLVWLVAKLAGRTMIDISFVKHLQMVLFALESMFFAGFVYLFLFKRALGKNLHRIVISVATAALWMLFPVNAWYLPNVFFTDQSVIFYAMLFLLLEALLTSDLVADNRICRIVLKVLHFITIYCGIMTDYFFWILVFFVFVTRIVKFMLEKEPAGSIVKKGLAYAVPVMLAVLTFFIQLQFVEDWLDILQYKLRFRTGGDDSLSALVSRLVENFTSSFTQEQRSFMLYLWLLQLIVFVTAFLTFEKGKRIRSIFTNSDAALVLSTYVAVAFQILMLKNHSAVHEFSMMKAGWCIAMTAPVAACAYVRATGNNGVSEFLGKKISALLPAFGIVFFMLILISGVPTSTSRYIVSRDGEIDYSLDEFICKNTDYYDVCFSFMDEIPYEPPMDLTVSHERVYLIESEDELSSKFPGLDESAHELLLVNTGSDDRSAEIQRLEESVISHSTVRAEENGYILYEIK